MNNSDLKLKNKSELDNLISESIRYFTYWPFYLISVFILISASFIYLRYSELKYSTYAKIEIIDKAQDSEMALPTAMTIFNRSMINLDNEIGRLKSLRINEKAVQNFKGNIIYKSIGRIKTSQDYFSSWYDDYIIEFNIDTDTISNSYNYILSVEDDNLLVERLDIDDNIIESYSFSEKSTFDKNHNLIFDIKINSDEIESKSIHFYPVTLMANRLKNNLEVIPSTDRSDQLDLSLIHPNKLYAKEYLNSLIEVFDEDGVDDRRSIYKNTIDFVDSRFVFLDEELEYLETKKQEFKQKNNLFNIETNANRSYNSILEYDSKVFELETQSDLIDILKETIDTRSNIFSILPSDFGLNNVAINSYISDFNDLITKRNRYVQSVGEKNRTVLILNEEIDLILSNLISSLENYQSSVKVQLENIKTKENEFDAAFNLIPQNEKDFRSIERELQIKEALFLLLLQKKEEASINYSVVKPTIKVIDYSISSIRPVNSNQFQTYLISIIIGLTIPTIFLFILFSTDNKIHSGEQLRNFIGDSLPILAEVPFVKKANLNKISDNLTRDVLSESLRILIANFKLLNNDRNGTKKGNVILVTSSIKGEGKTLVSVNLSSLLSTDKKVALIGADLRNPQIHKLFGIEKNISGLSSYIFSDTLSIDDVIHKHQNLDVIFSGPIPPNPSQMLSSQKFKSFIDDLRNRYDYIVIDSAPTLLVSDTFEISTLCDATVYIIRSNFTPNNILNFIVDNKENKKLNNINLVLNSVGNSQRYGYRYGYQYGYRYGYNYGYGYGYREDD